MLSIDEAFALIDQIIQPGSPQSLPLQQSQGHILAQTIAATIDSPPFNKALMDGFAIRSQDVQPGCEFKIIERLTAGQVPTSALSEGITTQVMTGTELPEGADAVVRIEDCEETVNETVRFSIAEISRGRNAMFTGESMRKGEELLEPGNRLSFLDLALLAENGIATVNVSSKPTVAVLATGDELVPIDQTPAPGEIRNTNEAMLLAQLAGMEATANGLGIARDNVEDLRSKISMGLQSDFLLLSGGVSAGVLDLVPATLKELGVEAVFHKVHLKPGKPIWFGVKQGERPCYVFGLPGNPVSSMVCCELFVRRALRRFESDRSAAQSPQKARLDQSHLVKGDRPVYYPAKIWLEGTEQIASPVRWMGSADLRGAAAANGLIHFSPRPEAYQEGETVEVIRFD